MSERYPTLFGCNTGAAGDVVVVGVPYDRGGSPDRAGCSAAPAMLRRLSAPEHLRVKDGVLYDIGRGEVVFAGAVLSDLGDIKYRPHQTDDEYLEFIANAIFLIAREGKCPLVLGGDHLVTLAALRGVARTGRAIVQVLQLDAHHDYDAVEAGERPTHATFISFVASEGLASQVLQLGVRGLSWGTPEPPAGVRSVDLSELRSALFPGGDVYLTIDTDAFDPTIAPAVGYPEPGGLAFGVLDEVLSVLRDADVKLVAADWTEYNPSFDNKNCLTGRTVLTGLARIVRLLSDGARAHTTT